MSIYTKYKTLTRIRAVRVFIKSLLEYFNYLVITSFDSSLSRISNEVLFAKLVVSTQSRSGTKFAQPFIHSVLTILQLFSHVIIIAYFYKKVRLSKVRWDTPKPVPTGTFGLDPINAWGENTSTFSEAILSKQVISVNQESPCL